MMQAIWEKVLSMTPDDFNKVALALVALIALALTPYIQWRIARRQAADNISAKRQVWIDELRADVAEHITLMARLEELRRPAQNLTVEDASKNFDEFMRANARAMELGIRIKLRLNPKEDQHNEFVRLLGVMADTCTDPLPFESIEQRNAAHQAFGTARDSVIAHLQMILKHEWERVKSGTI